MIKVLVAIPSHSGDVTCPTLLSLLQAKDEFHERGWLLVTETFSDSDIARGRNVFIGSFLNSKEGFTHLFYLDADVSCSIGGMARLVSHGVDFAAGVYRQKRPDLVVNYPLHWPQKRDRKITDTGPLFKADLVPAGFLCLSRACIERMAGADGVILADDGQTPFRFPFLFDWSWEGDPPTRRSEDYTFCKRWRDMGGEIWVDPVIEFGHTGKFTYSGALINEMNREYHDYLTQCSPSERAKRMLAAGA